MLLQGKSNSGSGSVSTPTLPVSIPCSSGVNYHQESTSPKSTSSSPKRNRLYQKDPLVVPKVRKKNGDDGGGAGIGSPSDRMMSGISEGITEGLPPSSVMVSSNIASPVHSISSIQTLPSSSYVEAVARYDTSRDGIGAEYIPGSVTSGFETRGKNMNMNSMNYLRLDSDGDLLMGEGGGGSGAGAGAADGVADGVIGPASGAGAAAATTTTTTTTTATTATTTPADNNRFDGIVSGIRESIEGIGAGIGEGIGEGIGRIPSNISDLSDIRRRSHVGIDSNCVSPNTSRRSSAVKNECLDNRPYSGLSRGFAKQRQGDFSSNDNLTLGIVNKKKDSISSPTAATTTPININSDINNPHSTHNQHPFPTFTPIKQPQPQDIPGEIEFSPTMISSPTLGFSDIEWKKIPFSTRKKLKSAVESGSFSISSKDLPPQVISSLKSAPISRATSMSNTYSYGTSGGSSWSQQSINSNNSSSKQPFSRRIKERAATMYPALGHIDESLNMAGGLKAAFTASSPRNTTLSRSTSLSNNSSLYSESPAFQFLSRFGSLNSDSNSNTNSVANSRNASFVAGISTPNSTSSYVNDPEMGEQVGSFFLGKVIGFGGFSQVREAHTIDEETNNKIVRAVKIVKKVHPSSSVEDMERVQNEFDHEVSLWKTLHHPHILKLLSVEDNEKATYCFTERITGGTLFDLVRNTRGKNLDYDALKRYIFQLSTALLYLHETKFIVHRDVKLENCLLEDIGNGQHKILLCDFGLSDYYGKSSNTSRNASRNPSRNNSNINITNLNNSSGYNSLSTSPESSRSILSSSGSERSMNLIIGPSETSSTLNHHQQQKTSPANSSSTLKAKTPDTIKGLRRRSTSPARMFGNQNSSSNATVTNGNCGSMPYASPQLLLSDSPLIHPSVDMWALGVCIYALYMGQLPWNHTIPPILRSMILNNPWDEETMKQKVGPEITDLVSGCLSKDQNQRSTIRDIIYQPIFNDLYNEYSEALK